MRKNAVHIVYHIVVILASAAFAFFLPEIVKFASRKMLLYWSYLENQELFLVSIEIAAAVALILAVNGVVKGRSLWKRARMAKTAGLDTVASPGSLFGRRRVKKLKKEQGHGRSVMVISSTGYRTFADPGGELHEVLRNCREAKIMLLDPLKDGVSARARSLADPEITAEGFREQIVRSIDFLKGLKQAQKNVRLKLYREAPLLKLAILGDYLCMQHYPAGRNVRTMPEYVFRHDKEHNLFSLFYQYFVTRWFDPAIPEYDLDTDELVYRDRNGSELRREPFNETVMELT